MKIRYSFVDWAKALGIFFVCVGHFLPVGSTGRIFLYSFHVPLFFVIAGFLANNHEFRWSYIKKLTLRLLIPYAVWFLMSVPVQIWLVNESLLSLFDKLFFLSGTALWNSALWFIPCYFIVNIAHYILTVFLAKDKLYRHCLFVVLFFVGAILFDYFSVVECFLGINKCTYLLGVQFVGSAFRLIYEKVIPVMKKTPLLGLGFFALLGVVSCAVNGDNNISILNLEYNNIFWYIPLSVLMSIFFLWACMLMKRCRFVELISLNTIPIMCGHLFVRLVLSVVLVTSGYVYIFSGIWVFLIFVIGIALVNALCIKSTKAMAFFSIFGFQKYSFKN